MIDVLIDLDPVRVVGAIIAVMATIALIPAVGWYAALRPGGALTETAHRRGQLVYTGAGRAEYTQIRSHRSGGRGR